MITYSKLGFNGRFGNQLFQFAGTIGIGDKSNCEVVFPLTNVLVGAPQQLSTGKQFIARVDFTNCFDIDEKYFSDNIKIQNRINEKFFHFDETLMKVNDFTDINGYLQSDKYFAHCESKIKDILKFKPEIYDVAKSMLPKSDKTLVAIHVRRGDYLNLVDFHPWVGEDYLNQAISLFDKSEHHFVVCSDDYTWCNEQWGEDENFTVVKSPSHFIDFCIMTMCDHHITSNSSFSWWSSYLSKNETKKVIAPNRWFGSKFQGNNLKDLYRDKMIKI